MQALKAHTPLNLLGEVSNQSLLCSLVYCELQLQAANTSASCPLPDLVFILFYLFIGLKKS